MFAIFIYIYIYIYISVYIYVYIYICVYIYIYRYIYNYLKIKLYVTFGLEQGLIVSSTYLILKLCYSDYITGMINHGFDWVQDLIVSNLTEARSQGSISKIELFGSIFDLK